MFYLTLCNCIPEGITGPPGDLRPVLNVSFEETQLTVWFNLLPSLSLLAQSWMWALRYRLGGRDEKIKWWLEAATAMPCRKPRALLSLPTLFSWATDPESTRTTLCLRWFMPFSLSWYHGEGGKSEPTSGLTGLLFHLPTLAPTPGTPTVAVNRASVSIMQFSVSGRFVGFVVGENYYWIIYSLSLHFVIFYSYNWLL